MDATLQLWSDAREEIAQTSQTALETLEEEANELTSSLSSRVQEEVQELAQNIADDFKGQLVEGKEHMQAAVAEQIAELRSALADQVTTMVHAAEHNVHELSDKLDNFTQNWSGTVSGIQNKFTGIKSFVDEISRDVTSLTEVINLTQCSTGTGINLAIRTLEDIRATLEDIV